MPDSAPGEGTLVCIPTYNEKENLSLIVPAVLEQVPAAHVLIVDDNSPDGTGELADALAAKDERVHVLHRSAKEGLGRAYLAAFAWALEQGYEKIFEFDADFSHDPKYLPEFTKALDTHDVVIGSRRVKGGGVENWSPSRRFISWGGSLYARTLLSVPIKDLTGGFNGFRRSALEAIDYGSVISQGYVFQVEIKYRCHKAGLRIIELPIVFPDRERGISKMSSNVFTEAVFGVLRLRNPPSHSPRWR